MLQGGLTDNVKNSNLPFVMNFASAYALSFAKRRTVGKRLLIVKPDAIGDQVLFSCVLPRIRNLFPGHEIAMLVQERVAGFYKSCPHVDRIVTVDREGLSRDFPYAIRTIRSIRKERYSLVIHAVHSRESAADNLAIASGAGRIACLSGDETNEPGFLKRLYDLRYSDVIPDDFPGERFEGYRYLAIPSHFGQPAGLAEWRPAVWIGDGDRRECAKLLDDAGMSGKPFAVVVPGAGEKIKMWSIDGFAAIADRVASEKGLAIILAGGPGEEGVAAAVAARMRFTSASVVGATSIGALAALIERASLVLGNDSAPIHLAMAVGTPAVCVMGGGHYGRFLPYPGEFPLRCVTRRMECFGCDWACRYDSPYCISRVEPEEVWKAAAELLNR